jgi:hypothetical protein
MSCKLECQRKPSPRSHHLGARRTHENDDNDSMRTTKIGHGLHPVVGWTSDKFAARAKWTMSLDDEDGNETDSGCELGASLAKPSHAGMRVYQASPGGESAFNGSVCVEGEAASGVEIKCLVGKASVANWGKRSRR